MGCPSRPCPFSGLWVLLSEIPLPCTVAATSLRMKVSSQQGEPDVGCKPGSPPSW